MKDVGVNVERLLTNFDRIVDAPDAVPRLRRFILDLAVRGKLVPQDPNDEPAAELLKRISAEKARLVKAGEIREQSPFQSLDPREAPFDLPRSWNWSPSTYPSYVVSDKGKKVQIKDVADNGKFPVVDQGKMLIRGYHNDADKVIRVRDHVILFGDHTREMKLIDFDFIVGADGVKLLRPILIHAPYYFFILQWLPLDNRGYGRHFKLLKASFIPLPPLAEQHRIAAKVDELMALCARLEAARTERETTRDRLVTTSLGRLNAPDLDPVTFRNHADFALNNLTPLTTRADQIKALRQTILNLAVRGKLVPQDPNDEPASELLKRIAVEKARLVRDKKITKPRLLPEIDEPPYNLPSSWCWTRMRQITSDRGQTMPDAPFTYIDVTSIDKENGIVAAPKVLEAIAAPSRARKITLKGDVIYSCVRPYLLNVAVIDEDFDPAPIASTAFAVLNGHGLVLPHYLWIVLRSPFMVECVEANMRGQAYPAINDSDFSVLPVPLPPLAEQHRIVAKIDELMTLCARLELILARGDDTRRRLLDAVLHEALEPDGGRGELAC